MTREEELWKTSLENARLFAIKHLPEELKENGEWLVKASLVQKPVWAPWPNSSTTVSDREIWINKNFPDRDIVSRAAHLIHESEHLLQYRDVGRLKFLWKYATSPSFREWAEVGAVKAALIWQRHLVPTWVPNWKNIASHIVESYALSHALEAGLAKDLAQWWVQTKPKT